MRGEVTAASAYATIRKETSFPAACFHPKLKKLTIDQSKDLCPSIPVEDVEELNYSFNFNAFYPLRVPANLL